jgi:hypothetical protein
LYDYKRGNIVDLTKKATGVMLAEIEKLKESVAFYKREAKLSDARGDAAEQEISRLNALIGKTRTIIEGYRDTLKLMVKEAPTMQLHVDRLELFIKEIGENESLNIGD